MDCQLCQIEIEEIESGALLSVETNTHLSRCEACRAFYADRQTLRRLINDMEPVSAPADFDFRLRARLAASSTGHHRSSWRSFVFSAPAIGLAASLIVLGVAATAFYNRTAPVTQPIEIVRQKTEQPGEAAAINSATSRTSREVSPETADKKNGSSMMESPSRIDRQSRVASGKVNQRRNQTSAPNISGQSFSNELMGRGAPVITPYGGSPSPIVGASPLVEVSVRSKSQPLKISLDERGGVQRTVTLEPVIFGSQDLTGRETSRAATSNGIW